MAINPSKAFDLYGYTHEGPFLSLGELTAAMAHPRYAEDDAYRASVMDKLSRTDRSSWSMADTRPSLNFTQHNRVVEDDEASW